MGDVDFISESESAAEYAHLPRAAGTGAKSNGGFRRMVESHAYMMAGVSVCAFLIAGYFVWKSFFPESPVQPSDGYLQSMRMSGTANVNQ